MILGYFFKTFTANGTWTAPGTLAFPPAVYAQGPGGSGAGSIPLHDGGAGGGGGGIGAELALGGVAPGTVLTITVPAGGSATATTVTGGSVTVTGNAGANGTSTGAGAAGGATSTNSVTFAGGTGGAGITAGSGTRSGGSGGGSAGAAGAGGNGTAGGLSGTAGGTAGAGNPGGAVGGAGAVGANGGAGNAPGAGGAGAGGSGLSAGAGAAGQVLIIWAVWLPDQTVHPHAPIRQTGTARGSAIPPAVSTGPTTPAKFTQPGRAGRGAASARKGRASGSTGAPVKPQPAPVLPQHVSRGRPSARKGTAAGSAGAPVITFPAKFTQPGSAVRGQRAARRDGAQGSSGVPVRTFPAPFTQPGSARRGQEASRKGASAGLPAQALTCGSTIASPGLLAGNLLSQADSDFETWSGHWTAGPGTMIAQSNKIAFCGCDSLVMTATGPGSVSATSPFLPFGALGGLDASGYLNSAYGATGYITVSYYNAGLTLISATAAAPVGLLPAAWTPVVTAQGAPAGTAWITLTYTVTGMAAGQTAFLDLAYAASTPAQILIAWPTQPTSATPLFCDVTPWVRADKGIRIGRGRVDEVSEVQASKLAMTVDNTTGWFSAGSAASPWSPGVLLGRRTQVKECDQTGAWHTRFDGTLTDLPVTWAGPIAAEALTPVAASGVLAKLGRAAALRTMLEQEILQDSPMVFYALTDASAATTASDSSGNSAPPLAVKTYGTGGKLQFASGGAIVEAVNLAGTSPLTSILCTPVVASPGGPGNQSCQQLEGYLPAPVTAAQGFTFEIWTTGINFAFNAATATWYAIALGNPQTGEMIGVNLSGGNGTTLPQLTLLYTPSIYSQFPRYTTFAWTGGPASGFPEFQPGMYAVTVQGTTATLWYNNGNVQQVIGSIPIPATFAPSYLTVGGPLGGSMGWQGSLNCAAVFPSVLSAARLQTHFQAGWHAFRGSYTCQLIGNVARYAGLPAWQTSLPSAGVSRVSLYSLSGQNALAALQTYEQVDGGLLYENAAGQLAYQDRSARYAAQASTAPVLVLAAGQYEPDLLPSITDQFLVNDCTTGTTVVAANGTGTTTTVTAWTRAVNAVSVADYGQYPSGTPQSPQTGPYATQSAVPGGVTGPVSLDVCGDAANWTVGTRSQPGPRSPVVTVDLLTQPRLRAAVLSAEMGTLLQLQGLPGQYPGGVRPAFMLIEGVTDTLKWDEHGAEWTVTFNTSPSMQSGAWLAGDPGMGVLDSTAVPGRGSDGNSAGQIGPPYTPPAFTTTMNLTGNVGANDMRGITASLQQALTPPIAYVSQQSLAQVIASSAFVEWDTIGYDTALGFQLTTISAAGATSWYTIPVTGTWLLMATLAWASASGAWVSAAIVTGTPASSTGLADQIIEGASSGPTSQQVSIKASLAAGTTVGVLASTSAASLTLSNATGGCTFSLVFLGETPAPPAAPFTAPHAAVRGRKLAARGGAAGWPWVP